MKKVEKAVRVFAPASVGNMAVGFDILGFAIEAPGDEIIARWGSEPGLKITQIHGSEKKKLPREVEKNTASYGVLKMLEDLGKSDAAIELEIFKKMPFGSGMGSSAASAAGGVMAVNELLKRPLEKKQLAKYAVMGESAADGALHGDNVIPSLLGGIVLIRDNETCDFVSLPVPRGIYTFLIYPHIEILTKDARGILSDQCSLKQMIQQTGNIGALVHGLYTTDLDLIKRSLVDNIIEPQRAQLIPHFYDLKQIAMDEGAMNYTISGAGPSMFGLAMNSMIANDVAEKLKNFLWEKGIESTTYVSQINTRGAYKM